MTPVPTQRRRGARLALALFFAPANGALLLAPAALGLLAPHAARADAGPAAVNTDQRAYWHDKAAELRARVAAAAIREQAATDAYSRMLTRRYPSGDAKQAILDERDLSLRELAEAKSEIKQFKEEARRAGVPDRWIDPDGEAPAWWIDPDS